MKSPLFILLVYMFFMIPELQAAGMRPDTTVVLIEEAEGEASINVKNTDPRPALLYSQILPIEGDGESLIVLTPPVARVEAGEVQSVRFILKTVEPLKVQRLRRVIFEGIPPKRKVGEAQVTMNIRQNLPVIINPKGLPKDKEPWRRLKWSIVSRKLQVSNPSDYVVRLRQTVSLNPTNIMLQLPRAYLLPGDVITLNEPVEVSSTSIEVVLSPANVYGYSVGQYTAPVER